MFVARAHRDLVLRSRIEPSAGGRGDVGALHLAFVVRGLYTLFWWYAIMNALLEMYVFFCAKILKMAQLCLICLVYIQYTSDWYGASN
jgi:hypothetical protein